jgi:hypothetical protein
MPELLANDRPSRHKGAAGGVTATALAVHLGVSQPYISLMAAEGVIPRRPDGRFDQDVCRLAYLKWLRDPARRSVRSQADAAHVTVKTDALRRPAHSRRLGCCAPYRLAYRDACVSSDLTGLGSPV